MPQRLVVLLFLACQLPLLSFSQRSHVLSIGMGTGLYFGDLSDRINNNLHQPGISLQYQVYLHPVFSLKASFTHTQIGAGDQVAHDPARLNRNLSFRSPLSDVSFVGVWELPDRNFGKRWTKQLHLTPYIFAGVGGFMFNPQAMYQGTWYALQPLGTEGQLLQEREGYPQPYALRQWQIPAGLGVSIRFSPQLGAFMEVSYHKTFTDYLDDVSTYYPDPEALRSEQGELAVILSNRALQGVRSGEQRGNPEANDSYMLIQAGLNLYFAPWGR